MVISVPSSFAIYGAAELTPETPGFVRVWTLEQKAGFIEVVFAVDTNDGAFRRSKATGILLDLHDSTGSIFKTELGASLKARQRALSIESLKNPGIQLDAVIKQFAVRKSVAFYRLTIHRSYLPNSRVVIQAESPLETDIEYWFSLNRFHTKAAQREK